MICSSLKFNIQGNDGGKAVLPRESHPRCFAEPHPAVTQSPLLCAISPLHPPLKLQAAFQLLSLVVFRGECNKDQSKLSLQNIKQFGQGKGQEFAVKQRLG